MRQKFILFLCSFYMCLFNCCRSVFKILSFSRLILSCQDSCLDQNCGSPNLPYFLNWKANRLWLCSFSKIPGMFLSLSDFPGIIGWIVSCVTGGLRFRLTPSEWKWLLISFWLHPPASFIALFYFPNLNYGASTFQLLLVRSFCRTPFLWDPVINSGIPLQN